MTFAAGDKQVLSNVALGRDNNLAFVRLVCACLVICSHSFALLYGPDHAQREMLDFVTGGQLSFGAFAVGCFFLFGGYLIAGSVQRSPSSKAYFSKRARRLFPELVFFVVLFAFVVGPIVSSFDVVSYFGDSHFLLFLLNGILIPYHYLPGVFVANPYQGVVNGSLWTLPVEFFCYVLVFLFFKLTGFEKRRYAIASGICIIPTAIYFLFFYPTLAGTIRPVFLFWIGASIYVYKDQIAIDGRLAFAAFLVFLLLLPFGFSDFAMLILFPIFMFWAVFYTRPLKCSLFLI